MTTSSQNRFTMNNKQPSLNGLRVLNTRPLAQAQELNLAIAAAGGKAISCPTLAISPTPSARWLSQLPTLSTFKLAIFTSGNAVHCFIEGLNATKISWPPSLPVIAIGKKTAQALQAHQITVAGTPDIADSEHLLAMPLLRKLKNQPVLLIKGEGGRPLIPETLTMRGAILTTLDVYRRTLPTIDKEQLRHLWQDDEIDIIVFTSQEAMQNLFVLLESIGHTKPWLQHKPCLVISQRLAQIATVMGIQEIHVCQPHTVIEALHQFQQGKVTNFKDRQPNND